MKYIVWISVIFALILLFPIPLKITLIYDKGIFTLKLFKKELFKSNKIENDKALKEEEFHVETPKGKKSFNFKLKSLMDIIQIFKNTKFKFTLRTKINISYSIDDAAINAVVYGLLSQGVITLHSLLKSFLKVKSFKPTIDMQYNKNYFNIYSTSIIIVNLAKIIYVIVFIYYQYLKKRDPSSYEASILKEEF